MKGIRNIFITVFIDLLCLGVLIPILPGLITEEFGFEEYVVGLVAAIPPLMQFATATLWGGISDKWGRKPVLLAGILCNVVAYSILTWKGGFIFVVFS